MILAWSKDYGFGGGAIQPSDFNEPSADVAKLINQVRESKVPASLVRSVP